MTISKSEIWSLNFLIYKIEILPICYQVTVKFKNTRVPYLTGQQLEMVFNVYILLNS